MLVSGRLRAFPVAALTFATPAAASVRLMFDGERCEPDATPLDLDMEDGDQIVRLLLALISAFRLHMRLCIRRTLLWRP